MLFIIKLGDEKILDNVFDRQEFEALQKQYGQDAQEKEVCLNLTNEKLFYEFKHNIENDRRGEVAFAVERANGKIIVVRTSFYPEEIYRIPTGGINHGEDIIHALHREVKEELGLETDIKRFLGVIKIIVSYREQKIHFYSYIFWVMEKSGRLLADALEDEISAYKEVDRQQLKQVVNILNHFQGEWKDWCKFRAQTTAFIIDHISWKQQ
ncbi:MAG: NUDIX hydrolase [Firmicutes bacterium]|nr:NUDIX hydrolase [Bacillota bacterium]